jgi:hypothetical protein
MLAFVAQRDHEGAPAAIFRPSHDFVVIELGKGRRPRGHLGVLVHLRLPAAGGGRSDTRPAPDDRLAVADARRERLRFVLLQRHLGREGFDQRRQHADGIAHVIGEPRKQTHLLHRTKQGEREVAQRGPRQIPAGDVHRCDADPVGALGERAARGDRHDARPARPRLVETCECLSRAA